MNNWSEEQTFESVPFSSRKNKTVMSPELPVMSPELPVMSPELPVMSPELPVMSPAEPYIDKSAHIELPNSDNEDEELVDRINRLQPPGQPDISYEERQFMDRDLKARLKMREDKAYQFVCMVAGFAHLKVQNLWSDAIENSYVVDEKWASQPHVQGLMLLSPSVYGHAREAREIMIRSNIRVGSLGKLMEDSHLNTLFARLVAVRFKISASLSGSQFQLDRHNTRLRREQFFILKSMNNTKRVQVSRYLGNVVYNQFY